MIRKLITWYTNASHAIDENDGRRDAAAICAMFSEPNEKEKAARAINDVKTSAARDYLTKRGRLALTCPDFVYVPAVSTDIRDTMRNYILEIIPESKGAYKFLFDEGTTAK